MILHHRLSEDYLRRPANFKQVEDQAHRFAGAFLLPLAAFGEDLFAANLDAFRAIKTKWGVAISMMVTRARQTGLITEAMGTSLYVNLSRRGWRQTEPYDETMEPEEPRLIRRAFELMLT